MWGKDALNLEKQVEEGTPSTKQIVWGMVMDMQEMTCKLPEPKALKMRYLLALEELRYGCRRVRLRTARELRGLAQYASIAIPPLRTELSVLDVMLSTNKADGGFIHPNVEGEAAEEAAWQAWDETVELLRVWFEVPQESSFEATFDEMLTPRELLAIPGRSECLRWVGGDATLEVIGTLDWKSQAFMREPSGVMLEVLKGAPELCGAEVEVRIAIAELVCYVGYAAAVCDGWGGEVVAYATDNMNVRMWLATRKARTPMARHLLRILGMLETRYRFRTLAFYIRTYHNVTADWVSRESKEVVEEELLRRGWSKVSPAEDWPSYLKDALHGVCPALTPRRDEEMLVVDYQQKERPVRRITIEEEWLANGGNRAQVHQARMRGMTDQDLKRESLKCMPQRTAHHLMGWMERLRQAEDESKVGVCRDEDRRKMDEVVRTWLKAWRGTPNGPRRDFEKLVNEATGNKVGGSVKRRRPGSAPPGGDVRPVALGRSREKIVLDANMQLSKDKEWLDALAAEAIMSKLSEG